MNGRSQPSRITPKRVQLKEKFLALVQLSRISNAPTVVTNVLAGASLASYFFLSTHLTMIALAAVLFYSAGMYMNDISDLWYDKKFAPDRVLLKKTISVKTAQLIAFLLFSCGLILLFSINFLVGLLGLLLTICIIFYDFYHKTNPFSPLIMAICRALVYVIAFVAFSSTFTWQLLIGILFILLYIIGITYIAKKEHTKKVFSLWPAVLLFLPAFYPLLFAATHIFLLATAGSSLFIVYMWIQINQLHKRKIIGNSIGNLISGIALIDALIILTTGWYFGVFLAILAWALTHILQKKIKGT